MSDDKLITVLKSLPLFAKAFLKIRRKSGAVEPFVFNRAQQYLHDRLESQLEATGKVRAVVLKGRQQGCCLFEQMKVLTADYRWVEIKKVRIGDSLVSCDEELGYATDKCNKKSRKFRTTIVEHVETFTKEVWEVALDNGALLLVTPDHRMLSKRRGGCEPQWRHIRDFKVDDEMRVAMRPPNYIAQSYEDGWFGGIIDGEGSQRGGKGAKRLSVHQTAGPILDRMKRYFESIDMPYCEVIDYRTKCGQLNKLGDKPVHRLDIHRLPYLMELFARCRPTRFTNDRWYEGHELPGKAAKSGIMPWAKVVSIKPVGIMPVVDLQTSTKTFICEGLVSHNSTYIQGRDFHKVVAGKGKRAFILTHNSEATKNIFEMTKLFYDLLPPGLAPSPDSLSAKELNFHSLNSGYRVGTAGTPGVGRSQTIQLFHGSEVSFWPDAEEHAKGILQAVSNEPGTEIIMESTANGIGNYYYNLWVSATSGESDFQAIFLPWYWQDEYKIFPQEEFMLNDDEQALYDTHRDNGLTQEHLMWRRKKLLEFSKDYDSAVGLFNVEYPMTAMDAFRNPVADTFIKALSVNKARKNHIETDSPLVIGVDPAITGNDATAIIRRRGRCAFNLETHHNLNTMELVGLLRRLIDKERPSSVCIDCIGIGAGIVDRLKEIGYDQVQGVNVARRANDYDKFKNLRAELWHDMREWLSQEMSVQVPDSDLLLGDLTSLGYKYDSSARLQIESKDDLRRRGMKSCDTADALALTFYVGEYLSTAAYKPTFRPARERGMLT